MRANLSLLGFALTAAAALTPADRAIAGTSAIRIDPSLVAQPMTYKPPERLFVPLQKDREGLQQLHVLKTYDLGVLRAHPKVAFEDSTADFSTLFRDRRSLSNVAKGLRALPQYVTVTGESGKVYEIAEGLVIRQELAYRIRPGQCADPTAHAKLAAAGAACFVQRPMEDSVRAFERESDPRYVKDPARRAAAIASYRRSSDEAERMVDDKVRAFRGLLAASESRKIYLQALGPAEVQRIEGLSDDQIKDEMINSGEVRLQQTLFVPRAAIVQLSRFDRLNVDHNAGDSTSPRMASQVEETAEQAAKDNDVRTTKVTKVDLQPKYIYLTGFTLAEEMQWEVTFSFEVNWCLAAGLLNPLAALSSLAGGDCVGHYYVEPHAGFGYGFGLRFPITTSGHYVRRVHDDGRAEATVKFDFAPINGSANDYTSTGLPPAWIFDGQELVARVHADAGFDYKLPVFGSNGVNGGVDIDFTHWLPDPFTDGQFTPPAPGTATDPAHFIFDQIDLLGDIANWGFAGGKALPMVDVQLTSHGLTFDLSDQLDPVHPVITQLQHSGQTVPVGVESTSGHNSRFSLQDPTYNLAFLLTPGVDGRAFVDLAVWSHDWDYYLMFPELTVELPPGGMTFHCHDATQCHRDYYVPGDLDYEKIARDQVTAAPSPHQVAAIMGDNTDRPGFDYERDVIGRAKSDFCASKCFEQRDKCRAWTYVRPGVQDPDAVCYLKTHAADPVANDCCVSGTVMDPTLATVTERPTGGYAAVTKAPNRARYVHPTEKLTTTPVHGPVIGEPGGFAGPAPPMTGVFDTDFGVLTLTRSDGSYTTSDGRVTITKIYGDFMDGTWTQSTSSQQCVDGSNRGTFHFQFTKDGFTGTYGYCDGPTNAGPWNGKRR
jgi:hypothetical protein